MSVKYCAATHCRNNTNNSSHSFFRFPNEADRYKTWALAVGRRDLLDKPIKDHRLCAWHFEEKMFRNPQRNRLHQDAIPTRKLTEHIPFFETHPNVEHITLPGPLDDPLAGDIKPEPEPAPPQQILILELPAPRATRDACVGTTAPPRPPRSTRDACVGTKPIKPRKKKVKPQRPKSRKQSIREFGELCELLLPPNLATVVKTQTTLSHRRREQMRYSEGYKQFAMKLYSISPGAYRYVRSVFFLPTVRTVQRFTSKRTGVIQDS